jgi:hypothetical protein
MSNGNYSATFLRITAGLLLLLAAGCTKNFEKYNTNPYGLTEEDLQADYKIVGDGFKQIQLNIYAASPAWLMQLQQNLAADVYSGYMMAPTPFRGNSNNMNYDLVDGWNNYPWITAYDNIMAPCKDIQVKSGGKYSDFYAWSQLLKVLAMHRVSDIYGPVIYTHYGIINGDGSITYDSQDEAYRAFFKDLQQAIDTLTVYANNPASNAARLWAPFDYVYAGDYRQWVKFANSLRLRLAIRVSKVAPQLASQQGQAALAHPFGLLKENADNFLIDIGNTAHPLNVISGTWGDIRMGAPMESVLTGLADPRLPRYFLPSQDYKPGYKGIRNGIAIIDKSSYAGFSALAVLPPKIQLMTCAEVYFLKAEAALRGWAGAGEAKTNYENGIRYSMGQHAVDGTAYITDDLSQPAKYTDPQNAANDVLDATGGLCSATVKWNEALGFEQKLEKIILQKWIAMFPDGQEAWSEFRRTGYPSLFPVVINNSGGKISSTQFIRRINFPSSEYSTNPKGVADAVVKLGGADNGGTRLWWDKR